MPEFLLTEKKAREMDVKPVQQIPMVTMQVPKVTIHQRDDLQMFLLLKDTNC